MTIRYLAAKCGLVLVLVGAVLAQTNYTGPMVVLPKADDSAAAEIRLREKFSQGSNYVGWKAPWALGANTVWELPPVDGTANQCILTNGSAALGWGTCVFQNGTPTFTSLTTTGAITLGTHILPNLDATSDLGSVLKRMQNGYFSGGIQTSAAGGETSIIGGDLQVNGAYKQGIITRIDVSGNASFGDINFSGAITGAGIVTPGANNVFTGANTFNNYEVLATTGFHAKTAGGVPSTAYIKSATFEITDPNFSNSFYALNATHTASTSQFVLKDPAGADLFKFLRTYGSAPINTATLDMSLVPSTNNTYNLGGSGLRWNKIWAKDVDFSGTITGIPAPANMMTLDTEQTVSAGKIFANKVAYYDTFNNGWGNLLIQGRVIQSSNNIHLGVPAGSSIYWGAADYDSDTAPMTGALAAGGGIYGTGLDLTTTANSGIVIRSADNTLNGILYNTNNNAVSIGATTNHPVYLLSNNAIRQTISADGTISMASAVTDAYGLTINNGANGAYGLWVRNSWPDADSLALSVTGYGDAALLTVNGNSGATAIYGPTSITSSADSQLYLSDSAPSLSFGNNSTRNSSTMNGLLALATSQGHYARSAGDLLLATYGDSRGDIVINSNYQGAGTKNVLLQPSTGGVAIGYADPGTYKLKVNGTGYFANGLDVGNTIYGSALGIGPSTIIINASGRYAQNLMPSAHNTLDIGSDANSWKDGYFTGGVYADSGFMGADYIASNTYKMGIYTIVDANRNATFVSVNTPAFRLPTGAGAGKWLTSDSDGNASWTDSPATGITSINSQTGPAIIMSGTNGITVGGSGNSIIFTLPSSLVRTDSSEIIWGQKYWQQHLLPSTNGTYNLGSPTYKWDRGYFDGLTIDGQNIYPEYTGNGSVGTYSNKFYDGNFSGGVTADVGLQGGWVRAVNNFQIGIQTVIDASRNGYFNYVTATTGVNSTAGAHQAARFDFYNGVGYDYGRTVYPQLGTGMNVSYQQCVTDVNFATQTVTKNWCVASTSLQTTTYLFKGGILVN